MDVAFVVCAQSGVIDQTTNNLSIYNIFQDVPAPSFPVAINMAVIAHVARKKSERESVELQLVITLTGHLKPLAEIPIGVNFDGKPVSRIIVNISPMLIPGPGSLKASLRYRKKELGAWAVNVIQVAQAPLTTVVPGGDKVASKAKKAAKKLKR
jgi:hypothetical protein